MIDMFINYRNLSESYTPNNLSKCITKPCSYTKLSTNEHTKPYELYNAKGELEGYYWHYGDQVEFEFSIFGELTLNDGTPQGKYVDIVDFISDKIFTLTIYNFRMEPIYTESQSGERLNRLARSLCEDDLIDVIDGGDAFDNDSEISYECDCAPVFYMAIDAEKSKEFKKGIYYCSLVASSNTFKETLFASDDCKLLVK